MDANESARGGGGGGWGRGGGRGRSQPAANFVGLRKFSLSRLLFSPKKKRRKSCF